MTRAIGLCVAVFIAFSVGSSGGSPSPQGQDVMSGNWLLVSCQVSVRSMDDTASRGNTLDSYREGFCNGLVEGVSDASSKVCRKEEVTNGQELRVVLKYLQDHPEELHLRNSALVEKALVKAFPCH
jgi:hypothetical protein